MRGRWGEIIPVIGHIVDLGFKIADGIRERRAKRRGEAFPCPPTKPQKPQAKKGRR